MTISSLLAFCSLLYCIDNYRVEVFQMCITHLNIAIFWPNGIKQDAHTGLCVVEQMHSLCQICQRE